MTAFRRTAGVAALCAGLMLNAGCQGDGEAQPLPPADSSSTIPSKAGSGSPSATEPTQPGWQGKYSKKQIAAYEDALDRFTRYEQRSEPIWRRGKSTPAAEDLFKEYFYTWSTQLRRLQAYEQANVEIHGTPKVLHSRATRIRLTPAGQSVTVRQCVDYTTVTGFQNGQETTPVTKKPQVRIINMSRALGEQENPWKIAQLRKFEGNRPCKP